MLYSAWKCTSLRVITCTKSDVFKKQSLTFLKENKYTAIDSLFRLESSSYSNCITVFRAHTISAK